MTAVYRKPRARRSSRRADQRAAGATAARTVSSESGGSPSVAYAAAPDVLAGALSWLVLKIMTGVGSPQPWRSATAWVDDFPEVPVDEDHVRMLGRRSGEQAVRVPDDVDDVDLTLGEIQAERVTEIGAVSRQQDTHREPPSSATPIMDLS